MQWQIQSGAFNLETPIIKLSDIVHNLSHICRYTGSCDFFWSVCDHTILCDQLASGFKLPDELRLPLLLHDAAETYLQDQNGLWKANLGPWWHEAEKKIEAAIAKKFGFDPVLFSHSAIKQIDLAALHVESYFLFKNRTPELWSSLDDMFANSEVCLQWIRAMKDLNGKFFSIPESRIELSSLIIKRIAD